MPDDERLSVDDLGNPDDGIFYVSAQFGYMERPDVPDVLRLVDPATTEGPIDVDNASYFLSKLDLIAGPEPDMAPWRKRLFIATSYITADAALLLRAAARAGRSSSANASRSRASVGA